MHLFDFQHQNPIIYRPVLDLGVFEFFYCTVFIANFSFIVNLVIFYNPYLLVIVPTEMYNMVDFYRCNKNAKNIEKTRKLCGEKAADFCERNNISSCWSAEIADAHDYYDPWDAKL